MDVHAGPTCDSSGVARDRPGRFRSFCALAATELLAGLAAALLFAALAAAVMAGLTTPLDSAIYAGLRQAASSALDGVAHVVSVLGSEAVGAVHIILLVVLLKRRRFELAAGLFVATAGAGLLNGLVKDVFARPRPAEVYGLMPVTAGQVYSFPSGHAMVSAAFLFFLAYVAWPAIRGRRRAALATGLVVVLAIVGLARTYLGAHYLTDVVAGYLIGFVWADVVIVAGFLLGCRWAEYAGRASGTEGQPGAAASAPSDA